MKKLIQGFRFISKSANIPVIEKTIMVKDGIGHSTDLQNWCSAPVDIPDGVYLKKALELGLIKSEFPIEDYPTLPTAPVPYDQFIDIELELLHRLTTFCSTDELRPAMNCVYIDGKNIVSTDAHKLVKIPITQANNLQRPIFLDRKFIKELPKKGLCRIESIVEKSDFDYAILTFADFTYVHRQCDQRYPDYTAVWPETNPYQLEFKNDIAFDQLLYCSNANTNKAVLNLKHGTLRTEDIDSNREFSHTLAITNLAIAPIAVEGEESFDEIRFNLKFFQQIVKGADTIKLQYSAPNRCFIINDNYLLMPMLEKI